MASKKDDPAALQVYVSLMTKHQANLRAFIVSLMPGSQDVGDVLQETNAVLWRKRARFEHGTNFIAWAFKIARYEVMCQRNRSKRDRLLVFTEKLIDILAEDEPLKQSDEEVLSALDGCLAKLSDHERDLVEARYTQGRSLKQHAARTGRSPGSLRLQKGAMEGKFRSGVRVVVEAPCDLRVIKKDRVALAEGVAWFEVPAEAVGFAVEPRELTVVDLGTAFGIHASTAERDEVHVTRGAVEVTSRVEGGETQTLREGEARRVDELGKLHEIAADADKFATALPANHGLVGHWEFETQSNGLTPDSSGSGHSGRLEGKAKIVTDPERGTVLSVSGFRSRRDGVDIDSVREIPTLLAHRGATLTAWIKRNSDASAGYEHAYIVALGSSEDSPVMSLGITKSTGRVIGFVEGDGDSDQVQVIGDTPVADGVWTHVAITYDRVNNEAITYVNGVAQGSPTDISIAGDGALDWRFGSIGRNLDHFESDDRFFGGLIDDVRVYDRPLTAQEINSLLR